MEEEVEEEKVEEEEEEEEGKKKRSRRRRRKRRQRLCAQLPDQVTSLHSVSVVSNTEKEVFREHTAGRDRHLFVCLLVA